MNRKGQAALEYLMTYGWALIVIAIVVGVLIFIVSTPVTGVKCNSSDPTKIIVKSSNILATDADAKIQIQNATGGQAIVTGVADGAPFDDAATTFDGEGIDEAIAGDIGNGTTTYTWASAKQIDIVPDYADQTAGSSFNGYFTISYNDAFGYAKTATITCQGTV
ncbi:MAG: hypothetical protein JW744_01975 [Candidatus Diapherotrites archaeon]|uniref:Class III signal peptide-containing protein n=1 Tax=Candidatus Iainarchaeum sp. TaxID=3101447 RepID=A0A938YSF0_9ARCH|nr:hypothetical protein [Candidatus Diapherotrites archaeon]